MNRFPTWKYALIAVAIALAFLYTLPNFFGESPAVQVASAKSTVRLDASVVTRIEQVAKEAKISLQHEAMSATSGTDTDVIFWTRGGIPSALISLPNRYMHSPVELVSLKDLEKIPELIAGFALSLKRGEEFKVKI